MSTAQSATALSCPERIGSIDFFRGLTMLVMIFVNDIGDVDLGHIQTAPWWLKHMPGDVDGLTFVDVVFPAFLFIVGLSIPLALDRRRAKTPSSLKLGLHIVGRALGLIFIGVCMMNGCYGSKMDEAAMGMSGAVWRLLMFSGVALFWLGYPSTQGVRKWLVTALRLLGIALLVYALVIFRGDQNGESVWMQPKWWGILGLIGWAYLVAAPIGLACRERGAALMGAFALLMVVNIGDRTGALDWCRNASQGYLPDLGMLATFSSMVVAGMVVATLFRPDGSVETPKSRITWMLVFAAGCVAAGLLLRPLWGIHKNAGTPSWILISLAIACTIYALLYWLIDVKKITRGTVLISQAGSNTLLMYMLPYVFYSLLAVLGIDYLQTHFHEGWLGVARSATLALCLVGTTGLLSRWGVRLRL